MTFKQSVKPINQKESQSPAKKQKTVTFKEAVEQTPHLQGEWKAGLGALRAQDRPHIKAQDTQRLRGSVDLDTALKSKEPNANRWDFAIGYQHVNRKDEFIYWVETHTGSDKQIEKLQKKFEWLKGWLRGDGRKLNKFGQEFVWVPSGKTSFTKGATQVKILAAQGIRYSGTILRIMAQHPNPSSAN
ncbi:MAG: hypothetical protein NTX50_05400 [Candidatus Sumerlaeota bacterium]|nr:hypothetical protein [Candidatus Sumerlaeota bacterium]